MSKGATAYGRTDNRLPFLTQALGTAPWVAVERTSVEVFRCNHQDIVEPLLLSKRVRF